ncbi:hypothetical protein P152DRAFT_484820 [Eremomyces bilateralis CBS 781.70]|uniref:Uncharacterized protein n=1 Tax=Eremomyces bilateralis CBS 781.70 TaxID=1392243 RepID=A0A6G1FU67_9PEZI|nr:uncharacterized protein P152DRAFT_484820 [Eremomyces bilateralis CBS 781.70]KAF1809303.1 hypothetical protein P152DRAFT_484820 [Eremomyces bilateralis CBS 781.70]
MNHPVQVVNLVSDDEPTPKRPRYSAPALGKQNMSSYPQKAVQSSKPVVVSAARHHHMPGNSGVQSDMKLSWTKQELRRLTGDSPRKLFEICQLVISPWRSAPYTPLRIDYLPDGVLHALHRYLRHGELRHYDEGDNGTCKVTKPPQGPPQAPSAPAAVDMSKISRVGIQETLRLVRLAHPTELEKIISELALKSPSLRLALLKYLDPRAHREVEAEMQKRTQPTNSVHPHWKMEQKIKPEVRSPFAETPASPGSHSKVKDLGCSPTAPGQADVPPTPPSAFQGQPYPDLNTWRGTLYSLPPQHGSSHQAPGPSNTVPSSLTAHQRPSHQSVRTSNGSMSSLPSYQGLTCQAPGPMNGLAYTIPPYNPSSMPLQTSAPSNVQWRPTLTNTNYPLPPPTPQLKENVNGHTTPHANIPGYHPSLNQYSYSTTRSGPNGTSLESRQQPQPPLQTPKPNSLSPTMGPSPSARPAWLKSREAPNLATNLLTNPQSPADETTGTTNSTSEKDPSINVPVLNFNDTDTASSSPSAPANRVRKRVVEGSEDSEDGSADGGSGAEGQEQVAGEPRQKRLRVGEGDMMSSSLKPDWSATRMSLFGRSESAA